jgi:E3 ubiquitin-protein ligase RNF13
MRPIKESNEGCIPIQQELLTDNWIAIVERGGCTFVEKVRSLQKSGAKAVIIGDKHYNGWITMYATGKNQNTHEKLHFY